MRQLFGAVLIGALMCSSAAAADAFTAADFKPMLKLNVDAREYNPERLAKIANRLTGHMGEGDAFRLMTRFVRGGLSEDEITTLLDTAYNLSVVYKWSITDSIDTVTKGFFTSYNNTRQLDSEINYLSADESDRISKIADSDPDAAIAEAYKLFRTRLSAAVATD